MGVGVDLAAVRPEAIGVRPDTHLLDEGRVFVATRLGCFLVGTGRNECVCVREWFQGFQGLLSFVALGARKESYVYTMHSL